VVAVHESCSGDFALKYRESLGMWKSLFKLIGFVIVYAVLLMQSSAEGDSTPFAAPAAPGIFYLFQPDGSKISVCARGDDRFSWMETTEGYSIEKATDGLWYYVSDGSGLPGPVPENKRNGFVLTNVQAHLPPPKTLTKHIRPPALLVAPKGGEN